MVKKDATPLTPTISWEELLFSKQNIIYTIHDLRGPEHYNKTQKNKWPIHVSYLEHAPDVYVTFSWRTLGDPSSHDEPLTDKHEADNRR